MLGDFDTSENIYLRIDHAPFKSESDKRCLSPFLSGFYLGVINFFQGWS